MHQTRAFCILVLIGVCDARPVARRQGWGNVRQGSRLLGHRLILAGIAARIADTRSKGAAASAAIAAAPPLVSAPAMPGNSRSIALSRGNGGHFWVDARV